MGAGPFMSALLHGSVIALTVIAWPRLMPPLDLPDEVLPVEILPIADDTNIAPEVKAEEPPPTPAPEPPPPPPEPQAAAEEPPPPPPPPEEAAPEPEAVPAPPDVKPEPAPPQPKFAMVRPRTKPKPEKKRDAAADFDALINKMAKEKEPPPKKEPLEKPQPSQATRTTPGVGAQTAMTMSEIDALRQQMMKCWNVPIGAPDPAALVLRVKVFFNQDGTVAQSPQLLDTMGMSDPYFRAAAESAMRAVKMCEPYHLPVEKYEVWSEVTITFDPRKMAGL